MIEKDLLFSSGRHTEFLETADLFRFLDDLPFRLGTNHLVLCYLWFPFLSNIPKRILRRGRGNVCSKEQFNYKKRFREIVDRCQRCMALDQSNGTFKRIQL